jgi:hypothetical protein
MGYQPFEWSSEDEAREFADDLISKKQWPCYFFSSDTTGEKDFEEFYTNAESVDFKRFDDIGVINNMGNEVDGNLNAFCDTIDYLKKSGSWTKQDLVDAFNLVLPKFEHVELNKSLDERM